MKFFDHPRASFYEEPSTWDTILYPLTGTLFETICQMSAPQLFSNLHLCSNHLYFTITFFSTSQPETYSFASANLTFCSFWSSGDFVHRWLHCALQRAICIRFFFINLIKTAIKLCVWINHSLTWPDWIYLCQFLTNVCSSLNCKSFNQNLWITRKKSLTQQDRRKSTKLVWTFRHLFVLSLSF